MNDDEIKEVEVINEDNIGDFDVFIDEALKERGSYCSICNID